MVCGLRLSLGNEHRYSKKASEDLDKESGARGNNSPKCGRIQRKTREKEQNKTRKKKEQIKINLRMDMVRPPMTSWSR